MNTYTIRLEKLIFFGFHGVNQDEIQKGQNFQLNLILTYQRSNNLDDIDNAIDYIELYQLIQNSFEEKRFNLLESLINKILNDIKSAYESALYIKLNIRKPSIQIENNKVQDIDHPNDWELAELKFKLR